MMPQHYSDEFKSQIKEMHASGLSMRKIAVACGASYSTVRSLCVPGALERSRRAAAKCRNRPGHAEKIRQYSKEWYAKNKGRKLEKAGEWKAANPIHFWATGAHATARVRAVKKGVPFTISVADILAIFPADGLCPVFGTELLFQQGYSGRVNSPSLDRIIPSVGYVAGNIAVISNRANMVKNDATPCELRALADWIESISGNRDDK